MGTINLMAYNFKSQLSDRPTLLEIFVFMMFIVCAEEDIAKFIYHAKKLGKCHLRQQACVCV